MSDALFCHRCGAALQALMAMQPCSACGKPAPADSRFCPYCRAQSSTPSATDYSFLEESVERPRESAGCPACGRTIGPTAKVCRYCGVNVDEFIASVRREGLGELEEFDRRFDARQREAYKPTRSPQPSAVSRPALFLLAGLAALAALFLFAYVRSQDLPSVTFIVLLSLALVLLIGALAIVSIGRK